jgi:large subunit ribosomal protein L3
MEGMLGKKVGMTQIFGDQGEMIPVTVLELGPCLVVQRKTAETDGYEAVQVGLVEKNAAKNVTKPMQGHFDKGGVAAMRRVREFRVEADCSWQAGEELKASTFAVEDFVDVTGESKGKGFQGVIKRYGFGGGKASHGSHHHRAPGSIGQSAYPSRVFPGARMPGRTGGNRVTVKNLRIVQIDEEKNLVLVRGAVPGPTGSYVSVRRAKRG